MARSFTATRGRFEGPGGWHCVDVPESLAPDAAGPWGRIPIRATVDGKTWDTSLWRDTKRGVLLAVPKKIRGAKQAGDTVEVVLEER